MVTIDAVFDGKTVHILLNQQLPQVTGEVPVHITFPDLALEAVRCTAQRAAVERLRQARATMQPLREPIVVLTEDGRER